MILDNYLDNQTKILIALVSGAFWIYYRKVQYYNAIPRKQILPTLLVVIWIYLNYQDPLFLPIGLLFLHYNNKNM